VQAAGGQILLDGTAVPTECRLNLAAADVRFSAELEPPFGKRQRLSFSGQPILRLQGGQVQLLEEVPLETYLAGVIPTEMSPSWPVEALKAQAIAARSYAAAKYLERFDRPWQLHWHYSVDMAYAGTSVRSSAAVRQALRETRGELLSYHGLPVPALFHACSGGATEAATNLWPTLAGADRKTPMAAQMPVVQDAAAEAGCTGLGFTRTHWRWKANLSLAEITSDLQAWARTHPEDKLVFGTVVGIEIASRHPDSGRVSLVAISHKLDGRTRRTMLPAADFRMAVDPGLCRSTWWDRCLVVSGKGGTLVLAGRGFGHGAGLSQVSAWQLARTGSQADSIVRRFYPQAALERRW
jgi:SpoIID/LytB domain protein